MRPEEIASGRAGCSSPASGRWWRSSCLSASASCGCAPLPKPRYLSSTATSTSPHRGMQGLSAPVTVRRDQHGVPHIDAGSQEDLFVAQGLRDGAGSPLADGRLPAQRQRGARRDHGPLAASSRQGAAHVPSFATLLTAFTQNLSPEDRSRLEALCARRQPLHHAAPGLAAARVSLSPLQAAALDGCRQPQHRPDDGRYARHALVLQAGPGSHRRETQQRQTRIRPLPGRIVARPSADRRARQPWPDPCSAARNYQRRG